MNWTDNKFQITSVLNMAKIGYKVALGGLAVAWKYYRGWDRNKYKVHGLL
jgi:hypothetical protein